MVPSTARTRYASDAPGSVVGATCGENLFPVRLHQDEGTIAVEPRVRRLPSKERFPSISPLQLVYRMIELNSFEGNVV